MIKTKIFKTLFIAALLTFLSANSLALNKGMYFEVEGLDARVSDTLNNNATYASSSVSKAGGTFTDKFFLSHKEAWGYRLALGYDACPACNVNYGFCAELTSYDHDQLSKTPHFVNSEGVAIPAIFDNFSDAAIRANTDYYAFDLLGHRNQLYCNQMTLQWFAGLRYAHFKQQLNGLYTLGNEEAGLSKAMEIFNRAEFDGVGPRIGSKLFFPVYCGLGVTGEISGALLASTNKSEFVNTGWNPSSRFSAKNDNTVNAVPLLSGKVGLAYQGNVGRCTSLCLEVGYRSDRYFNAMNHSAMISQSPLAVVEEDAAYHALMVSGPYLILSLHT